MSTDDQLEIYRHLQGRCAEIAQVWLEALTQSASAALDVQQLTPRLVETVERIVGYIFSEPFNSAPAQDIGVNLDVLDNLLSKDMSRLQQVLANALVSGLSAEQVLMIFPRIIGVMSDLTAGFYVGRSQRAKRFDMEAMSKMGHDLKTPINAITGFSRVILKGIDGPITEFQQQDLTSIYDAGKKLLEMINDMFEVAKSDAGKTGLYEKSFDVADLLGDLLKTAQPILAKREHMLEVHGSGDLGKMQVDASQVRWILLSLLFRAARLSESGAVSLLVTRERLQNSDWLLFQIARVGEPSLVLEDAPLQNIIEEADNDMEVGLITALRFCKEMGGNLAISEGDQGNAKFTVRLPARSIVPD
ncbi:MAG: HAMP domain-containing histidine kinase [Anaerolineae bacterium]|nr:HAMP domain-containing histidine kinase [Anaerolineae bacterium]